MTIWLIGGTQESATIAEALVRRQVPTVVTVVTETARSLYPAADWLQVWVGCLTPSQMPAFLEQQQIRAILDASHPFAADISRMAIEVAADQLPYLRYERPSVQAESSRSVERFATFESLLQTDRLAGRVLLTIGYRSLALFAPWQERCLLFARILPSVVALEAALKSGFTADRIIALRPPLSAPLETALWQQWQISTVVTKASGTAGGEAIKQEVAAALGVQLIVIDRPLVNYPQITNDLQVAVAFCTAAETGMVAETGMES